LPGNRAPSTPATSPKARLDIWLWQARFFKSRSLAADVVETGHCRINGRRVGKPAQPVVPGDVLTIPQGARVRLIRVAALGLRRGPACEAQALYADLDASPNPLE